jgi:CubicO group peptidase (beta-lactamase class C family)
VARERPAGPRRDSIDIYRRGAKYAAPEFGMFSTAHDMERRFRMMLNDGSLGQQRISQASIRAMLQPRFPTVLPCASQGLGWFICVDPEKQAALRLSNGSFGAAGYCRQFTGSWCYCCTLLSKLTDDSTSGY